MNPTKRTSVVVLVLCCIISLFVPAFASEVEPMSLGTKTFEVTLDISSDGQASCCAVANASLMSHKVEIVMSLNQIGQSTPLKSWSANGTGKLSLSQSYYVSKGYDYQVTATITVRDSSGKFIESFTTPSSVVHY